jgi:K+ transporter
MGCIFAVIALAVPRTLMVFAFLLTDWFGRGFETQVWPILGFVFMPYTTLAYLMAMLNNNHTLSGGWLALFIVAIIIDAGHWGGGGAAYRRK